MIVPTDIVLCIRTWRPSFNLIAASSYGVKGHVYHVLDTLEGGRLVKLEGVASDGFYSGWGPGWVNGDRFIRLRDETLRLVVHHGAEDAAAIYQRFAAMEFEIAHQWLEAGVVGAAGGPGRGGWALHMHLSAVFSDRARYLMGLEPLYPWEH